MVIEYAGTVIRAVLTDKRQKYYDGKVSNPKVCSEKPVVKGGFNGNGSCLWPFPSGDRLLHVPHR